MEAIAWNKGDRGGVRASERRRAARASSRTSLTIRSRPPARAGGSKPAGTEWNATEGVVGKVLVLEAAAVPEGLGFAFTFAFAREIDSDR